MSSLFAHICPTVLSIYLIIALGYIAGKFFHVDKKSIAALLFYIVIPIVFFTYALETKMQTSYILLPILFLLIGSILSIMYLYISKKIWPVGTKSSIIAFSAGTGNTGYFGLPVALSLFDDHVVCLYMLMNIGLSFYDYTVGAYVIMSGRYKAKDALKQVLKMPILYAYFLGLILQHCGFTLESPLKEITEHMQGTFVILGCMVIGLSLSAVKCWSLDWKFLSVFLSAKFIAAPILVILFVYLDQHFLHLYTLNIHKAMLLISFVPPASNTVIFATLYNTHPEKTATAVLVGTLIALFYIPTFIALFGG